MRNYTMFERRAKIDFKTPLELNVRNNLELTRKT